MSKFTNKQEALQTARTNLSAARQELYTAKELLKLQRIKIRRRLEHERLPFLPDTDSDQQLLVQLQENVFAQESTHEDLAATCEIAEEAFHSVDDHAKMVKNLNDDVPILLMPVRVQTRFVTVKHLATNISKEAVFDVSNVRSPRPIRPVLFEGQDTSLLHIPTYHHLKNNGDRTNPNYHHFIKNVFVKNKVYAESNLLRVVPDVVELWVRIYPDDIFVHAHEPHLTPDEQSAGREFWETWWEIHQMNANALAEEHASEDLSGKPLLRAWTTLQNRYRHNRAAWIFRETIPLNYQGKDTNYAAAPDFTSKPPGIKSDVWTEPILSWVMPDKFVVTLLQGGQSKHFEGHKIPHPLQLSPTPEQGGSLDEIKWAQDFEEAEKVGMAIKIPLKQNGFEEAKPIQQLVVAGVKASVPAISDNPDDQLTGKGLLEDLLENHRYKEKGMALLPQGTPTNNFERVRSGYTADGLPAEETFKLETGPPLFDQEDHWKTRKDGQYLVEALGIDPGIFQHIHKGDSTDIAHATAMNKLLWSATMGYYLHQFFQPLISTQDISKTRDFFFNHVAAGGLLPVIRLGKQPYGILPITNFANWKPGRNEDPFFDQLFEKVLSPLNDVWKSLSVQVKQLTDAALEFKHGQFSEDFVKILGLNASSQSFYQRPQVGDHLLESSIAASLATQPRANSFIAFTSTAASITHGIKEIALEYFNRNLIRSLNELGFKIPFETWNHIPFANTSDTKSPERIFNQHFATFYKKYTKDIIDPFKPSATRRLSKINVGTEEMNYLQWLHQSSYQALIDDHFNKSATEDNKLEALLYLLARQALARNYVEVAAKLMPSVRGSGRSAFRVSKAIATIDFELEHISDDADFRTRKGRTVIHHFGNEVNHFLTNLGKRANELEPDKYLYQLKKWDYLQERTDKTGRQTIGEFLDGKINEGSEEEDYLPLVEAKTALECLQNLSTAELHRLFTEHLDLCSYRFDAWMLGLVHQRLSNLRNPTESPKGIYLGAFGYVENLKPERGTEKSVYRIVQNPAIENRPRRFSEIDFVLPVLHFESFRDRSVNIDRLLSNAYVYLGESAGGVFERSEGNPERMISLPQRDPASQGFIHTPSQAHAVTAAILRSGFMANNPTKEYEEFAINLSSGRVRKALFYIDGMRNGQELAALLGYQFERELHDNAIPFLDAYLLDFRRAFPLRKEAAPTGEEPTETQQAFNVVHGLDLLEFYRANQESIDTLLTGKRIRLNISDNDRLQAVKTQIKNAIDHLSQSMDAISDLLVSESIYHTARGDIERSSSVLKMLSNDKEIAIPEITQTPKSGKPLAHLVGVQFDLKSTEKIWLGVDSPRSMLNPGLNRWLSEQLPDAGKIWINVEVNGQLRRLHLRQLRFQPIDLLALFQEKNPLSETSALSFYIKETALVSGQSRDAAIQIRYFDRRGVTGDQRTLGELLPLMDILGRIIQKSSPLFPTDLQLSSRTDPLDKFYYRNLHNADFIDVFEKILYGADKDSLNSIYNNIRDQTNVYNASKSAGFPQNNQQTIYTRLLHLLHASIYFNQLKEDYNLPLVYSPQNMEALLAKTRNAFLHFEALEKKARVVFEEVKTIREKKKQWDRLVELGKMIFGNTLPLMPKFTLNNRDEFKAAMDFRDLMADAGEGAKTEWLQGLALVREKIQAYRKLDTFRTLFKVKAKTDALSILQLPYQTDADNYRWLGSAFPSHIKIKGEQLSIALEFPPNYKNTSMQSGMIIDFWTERIQSETSQTAFALHYNQPNTEPPQSCLLCVSPKINGKWDWEDIVGCILTSIDMAKKRAVEPNFLEEQHPDDKKKHIQGHPLRFLLPALSIPVSNTENTPALNFDGDNNHF
jgi:hypothetical protein